MNKKKQKQQHPNSRMMYYTVLKMVMSPNLASEGFQLHFKPNARK